MKQIITTIETDKVNDTINIYIHDSIDNIIFNFTLTQEEALNLYKSLSESINILNTINNKYWE